MERTDTRNTYESDLTVRCLSKVALEKHEDENLRQEITSFAT